MLQELVMITFVVVTTALGASYLWRIIGKKAHSRPPTEKVEGDLLEARRDRRLRLGTLMQAPSHKRWCLTLYERVPCYNRQ